MNSVKLSVIVPVYNAEPYIADCIDSILVQTASDIEIILIDDGSADYSFEICEKYAREDSKIKLIHRNHNGQTEALKCGLSVSKGDWLFFMDADDTLPEDSLLSLLSYSESGNDIIVGLPYRDNESSIEVSSEEWRCRMVHGDPIFCTRWGKLFRRTLFDESAFDASPEIRMGEDMLMNITIALRNVKPVRIVKKKIYNYRQPATGITLNHVWTVDKFAVLYQAICDKCDGIITDDEIQNSIIKNGIGMVRCLCMTSGIIGGERIGDSLLVACINNLIEVAKYRSTFGEYFLLRIPDSIITRCLVKLQRKCTIIHQYLRRKLQ